MKTSLDGPNIKILVRGHQLSCCQACITTAVLQYYVVVASNLMYSCAALVAGRGEGPGREWCSTSECFLHRTARNRCICERRRLSGRHALRHAVSHTDQTRPEQGAADCQKLFPALCYGTVTLRSLTPGVPGLGVLSQHASMIIKEVVFTVVIV